MMIEPEAFYTLYLKGKSLQEIMKVIRSLKKDINRLKRIEEEPWLEEGMPEETTDPNSMTRIKCSQAYLTRAIQAYEEAGGNYKPSKAETKSMLFDQALESISRLKFSIGGFFGGYETLTYTISGDRVLLDTEHTLFLKPSNLPEYYPFMKEEFISGLRQFHIGEWKREYYNPCVCDGTQWELEILFDGNRKPVYISGSNAYPYNFSDLTEFLGVGWEEDEEEDEEDQD